MKHLEALPLNERRPELLGQILCRVGAITEAQLAEALDMQQRSGARLGRILIALGYVNHLTLAQALAVQFGLPFRDLILDPPPDTVVRLLDETVARRLRAIPLAVTPDAVEVAVADPGDAAALDELRRTLGRPLRLVVTSEIDIYRTLERVHRHLYLDLATNDLLLRRPEQSAHETFTLRQLGGMFGLGVALLVGMLVNPWLTATVVVSALSLIYILVVLYRFLLAVRALGASSEIRVSPEEVQALDEATLPEYTVLVALHREPETLPTLLEAIGRLDYPASKLDVKLIFEESDPETLALAKALRPPRHVQFLVVPAGDPQTKPRALNWGLLQATGHYCAVYDAEDIPEPDQLKKAVVAFRKAPADVVCLQARLDFYNPRQNLLTRWFTAEYAQWFNLTLPGLHAVDGVIPLGGTSNHFITAKLRELGAWDPYNVTEDADLGVRIRRAGYRTAMFNSVTYEEANSALPNWLRQRTRWLKGWMQTWLVHMRHPRRLWRELGLGAFLGFQATVGGTVLVALVNPLLWTLTTLWFLGHWESIATLFPGPVFYLAALGCYVGNVSMAYLFVMGAFLRGHDAVVRTALAAPLYWVLLSVAAWRAVHQLLVRPSYWEKTAHGLHRTADLGGAWSGESSSPSFSAGTCSGPGSSWGAGA